MASRSQDINFKETIKDQIEVPSSILDTAVEWVKENLKPEDVFEQNELADWAENNGYIKE